MQIEKLIAGRIKRKRRLSFIVCLIFIGIFISLYFTIKYSNNIENSINTNASILSNKVSKIDTEHLKAAANLFEISIESSLVNTKGSIALSKIHIFAVFQAVLLGFLIAKFISMLFPVDDKILLSIIQRLKEIEGRKRIGSHLD
jgi:hypothetical protein